MQGCKLQTGSTVSIFRQYEHHVLKAAWRCEEGRAGGVGPALPPHSWSADERYRLTPGQLVSGTVSLLVS
jgi:hypothetical protein